MCLPKLTLRLLAALAVVSTSISTFAQRHDPAMHAQHQAAANPNQHAAAGPDTRVVVKFPKAMRSHTLSNMRDHLLALQQIQSALASQEYDKAADIAEQRLGMTSLALHGAHESGKYMPKGMREAGTGMHRNASRFALAAKDAAATGDLKPALQALSQVTAQCVACHSGWRLK